MKDAFAMAVFVVALAVVPVWVSRLYLKFTQTADISTIPHKLRGLARCLPYITIVLAVVAIGLAFMRFSQNIVPLVFFASIISVSLQLVLIPVALMSEQCRARAISSTEGKAMRYLLIATFVAAKFAWSTVRFVLKHSVRSRSGGHSNPNRNSPYGYHGYESYSEKARRTFGGPDDI